MSKTYETLLSQIDLSIPRFESEEFGTIVTYSPSKHGGYSLAVIESFKSKTVKIKYAKDLKTIQAYCERLINIEAELASRRSKYAEERKAAKSTFLSKLEVGTILHGSWGYEQTNCEYFIVREIKGAKVKIQEIGHKDVGGEGYSSMSTFVMPDPDKSIGEVLDRVVAGNGIKLHSSCTLHLWDGSKNYSSWYA